MANNWQSYCSKNKIRLVEEENVRKVLSCRTYLLGKHSYHCPKCGYTKEKPHSCKSRFCTICGILALENWVLSRFNTILNCHYQHVVVTIPASFYWMVKLNRKLVLNMFLRMAVNTLQEWFKGKGIETPGIISFHHSFGSKLQFHPHFHLLVSSGGLKKDGTYKHIYSKFPSHILVAKFKAKFCVAMKLLFRQGLLKTKAKLNKIIGIINNQYNKHWQFYTDIISDNSIRTIRYCVRYAKKMVISDNRIACYDEKEVCFLSGKDSIGKKKFLTYSIDQFIKCVVQHIPEKNFKQIRYFGFYAPRANKKYKQAAKFFHPLLPYKDKLYSWRHRQYLYKGIKPLVCPHCKNDLVLNQIIFPVNDLLFISFNKILIANGILNEQQLKIDYG